MNNIGAQMYGWIVDLFPICRSLAGPGVRETLLYIQKILPEMRILGIESGRKVFDWTVPKEWHINEAYILDPDGKKIIDFKENNLHVVGYSMPVNRELELSELEEHLYSLPNNPEAIPYVTSYYAKNWGFCLSDRQRKTLRSGRYKVVIDSSFKNGYLNYGELIIKGKEDREIFLSTYICHPSMANNELSGPAVTIALARWIESLNGSRYTYRIIFIPETIGSIAYLSANSFQMKKKIDAGFNITCVGDNRDYSFLPSKHGNTIADRVAKYVLDRYVKKYTTYSFLDRGSDERQYCSPHINLPVVSIMRSKYGTYPEYHTSFDNLNLISEGGLQGSFDAIKKCILILENNYRYEASNSCEPQLGVRGLYPDISTPETRDIVKNMMNFLAYADNKELIEIAEIIKLDFFSCVEIANLLTFHNLIKIVPDKNDKS
jgi:aminopeptidase-like protein